MTLLEQLNANAGRGPHYEDETAASWAGGDLPLRLIAFYLPQFHPFPENNLWWGKGFTEWTNVTKSVPRFVGHYQPHLPGELGFYDLRMTEPLQKQAELARQFGIAGFCFHYYWFGGKRLLETPLHNLLAAPEIDMPFCINWANENWSRRWDGFDNKVLMAQQHSPQDDLAFAAAIEPAFRDRRYLRVGGRPLLMLYRPGLLPDAAATVARWREYFTRVGCGNPYVMMAQAFGDNDPRKYGMDAAVGFPPHNGGWNCTKVNETLELLDPSFSGESVEYEEVAARTLANQTSEYRLLPGVCPGWDNDARKPGRGFTCVGATPAKYGQWLQAASLDAMKAKQPEERIAFINAWNEWAEGAHLEPDRHHGYAFLAETARVLNRLRSGDIGPESRAVSVSAAAPLSRRLVKKLFGKAAGALDRVADTLRTYA